MALSTALLISLAACSTPGGYSSGGGSGEKGFVSLFDGQSLNGWQQIGKKGDGYIVTNGVIACSKGGGGKLMTTREYADFILRFDFRLPEGANNGVGIRAPIEGDAAYVGMELQILDDSNAEKKYGKLRPEQFHGSIYDVIAARRGALKPVGEWNSQEISAIGRRVKVVLNGQTIMDADLNTVTDAKVLAKHPGLLRERGYIGFLGHNDYVELRNLRIKDVTAPEKDNTPPPGFTALFNGKDLVGWKGLLARPNDNPSKRASLKPEELAKAQAEADENMRQNWKVEDGALVFSGKGRSLCTAKDYADFEMFVDWKIKELGDSGLYLRGTPQVQIWDPFNGKPQNKVGSGGLFNNKTNRSTPTKPADKPIGEWNRFRILMQGEKVTVFLNGELVVHNVTMENFWERDKPIYPTGQIELQNHGNTLWFKNVYLRELPRQP
ncbi:MAG: DUF1080 domain-containing protein [Verrucomicrobiota bacterium]